MLGQVGRLHTEFCTLLIRRAGKCASTIPSWAPKGVTWRIILGMTPAVSKQDSRLRRPP